MYLEIIVIKYGKLKEEFKINEEFMKVEDFINFLKLFYFCGFIFYNCI